MEAMVGVIQLKELGSGAWIGGTRWSSRKSSHPRRWRLKNRDRRGCNLQCFRRAELPLIKKIMAQSAAHRKAELWPVRNGGKTNAIEAADRRASSPCGA